MTDKTPDSDFFLQQMKDVKPIKVEEKVVLASPHKDKTSVEIRRKAATAELAKDQNFLSGEYIEPLDPLAVIEFKRDGVQNGVYRSLRMGKYQIDARLDLHNMTVEQARSAVFQFVKDCMAHDIRCALITHGKGEGREQPAQLKSCVAHWLTARTSPRRLVASARVRLSTLAPNTRLVTAPLSLTSSTM